jgi:hypothetical protein
MLLRMFEKRFRGHRAIGYARGEAPFGYAEPDETTVEYDEDALAELTGSEADEGGYVAFARHPAPVLRRVIDLRIFSSQQL